MLQTPPLGDTFLGEFEPGAEKTTDAQLEGWLRANATSDNHETGTASMMPRDLGGVVDTKLRVYGTVNVRVVGEFRSIVMRHYNSNAGVYSYVLLKFQTLPLSHSLSVRTL
jgi:hypothetical protein